MNKVVKSHEMHVKLGRIRFVIECIDCFCNNKPLPKCLCYIPSMIQYQCNKNMIFSLYSRPCLDDKVEKEMMCGIGTMIVATGMSMVNNGGQWIRVTQFQPRGSQEYQVLDGELWMMLPRKTCTELPNVLQQVSHTAKGRYSKRKVDSYTDVIDCTYALSLNKDYEIVPPDTETEARLCAVPEGWQPKNDQALVDIMCTVLWQPTKYMGTMQNYVNSIEVSSEDTDSISTSHMAHCLVDGDDSTYWQSDGHLKHWIKLHLKNDVIINNLWMRVDHSDASYLPQVINVLGGSSDNSVTLNTHKIEKASGKEDILILSNMSTYYAEITIQIDKNHSSGIDSRVHAIKLESKSRQNDGINIDVFEISNLSRYPELQAYEPAQLLARATVLSRFMTITDTIMTYVTPPWNNSGVNFCDLKRVRHILPLSKVRLGLVESFIKQTASKTPEAIKVCIDRRFTKPQRDFKQSLDYSQTIISQLYEGLRTSNLEYRWKAWIDQWWTCVFLSEGLDDHGGGFRDCISDISEELCPSSADAPLPTPFFIRSPNQSQDDIKINADTYVPCPSCKLFAEYTWIGKLMGACLRSSENLVSSNFLMLIHSIRRIIQIYEAYLVQILSLPEFVWKKLLGQEISWSDEFYGVDAAEVKFINRLPSMKQADFDCLPAERKTWSTVLSDGSIVRLRVNEAGGCCDLVYKDIQEFSQAVKETRLAEFDQQINAMREGLLSVIPPCVLDLLTWTELEKKVCGEPTISIDDLWKCLVFDTDSDTHSTIHQYLRSALENFTNEERSRFIKFVTGRRRLPVTIQICELDQPNSTDFFPEATTCAGYIYLPNYTSAKVAEEKLRYAIYNCVTIDTDE